MKEGNTMNTYMNTRANVFRNNCRKKVSYGFSFLISYPQWKQPSKAKRSPSARFTCVHWNDYCILHNKRANMNDDQNAATNFLYSTKKWMNKAKRPIVSVLCLLILLTARKLRAFISVTLWAFTCNNFHNEKLAAYNFMLFYVWCNIGAYIQSVPLSTNYHLCHLYSVEKRWFRCVKHCAIFHLIRPVSHAYCCGYASMISRLYLETRSDDCFTSRAVLFLYLL